MEKKYDRVKLAVPDAPGWGGEATYVGQHGSYKVYELDPIDDGDQPDILVGFTNNEGVTKYCVNPIREDGVDWCNFNDGEPLGTWFHGTVTPI